MIDKGSICYKRSKFDSSLVYYEKALELCDKEVDKSTMADIISNIGNVYEDLSNYQKALSYYKNALNLYEEIQDKAGISSSLNQIGNVYYRWSDFEQALKYYEEGLIIRKEIEDKYGIPSSLNNIGNIYYSWEKYNKALEYYLQALDMKNQLPEKTELPSYIINIGSAYLSLRDYNNAGKYYQRALKIAREQDNKHLVSSCLINIGVLYYEQKKLEKALIYYNDAYALVSECDSKLELSFVLRNLGETHIALKEYNKAKKFLLESLDVAEKEKLNSLVAEIYLFLHEIENHNKNYKDALGYYMKYTELNDSIFNEESSRKLNEFQSKYEHEKKENEIKQKTLELAEKHEQIQRQRLWFTIVAVIIIIIALIIYFYFRNREIKKRTKLENALNKQMQKVLSAQMNPHFISNALNSIQRYFLNNNIEVANEYLADFGALIRIILENSRKLKITLSEEIKSIELYISLEALRLENKFTYQISIHESIDSNNTYLPSMIIQPYIENAIWHGIAPIDKQGKINISFKKQDDYLVCIIEDNGIGIKKSEEIKKQYKRKHKSLGMSINKERLDLLNMSEKSNFSVVVTDFSDIKSSLHGTRVELKIPYITSWIK